jgi:hypothetical protein
MSPALRGDVYSVWLEFSALEFATYAFDLTALLSGRYERGRSSSLHGTQTAVRRIQGVLGLAKKHGIAPWTMPAAATIGSRCTTIR